MSTIICSATFTEDQDQALIMASRKGDLKQVQELLDQGADANAKDKFGRTVLDVAKYDAIDSTLLLHKANRENSSEELKIAAFADRVVRRGGELFFRLRDGKVTSQRDNPIYPAEGADYYSDATGAANVYYSFIGFNDPWYIIQMNYMESVGTELINRVTGTVISVGGDGVLSPDKTHLLVENCPSGGTEIWKLSSNSVAREWALGDCDHQYNWCMGSLC